MPPLVLLAVPYVATGSIGDLYTGLFVTPRGRLESGYYGTAGPVALAFAVPTLAVLYALGRRGRSARKTDLVASAAVAALLLVSVATLAGYLTMWYVTTALLPVGVLVGVVVLLREDDAGVRARRAPLFLLLALTAFVALVQFPFGAPVYFCFVAPLAVLAWLAMFRHTAPACVGAPHLPDAAARGDRRFRVRGQPQRALPGRDPSERQHADRRPRPRIEPGSE